ncbi:carbohydrate kinase family protein [Actinomadura rayongensis]|uniref:Carbohydrate kinase family protein n=1 Tax=Actinomadura rayongensis TaxID=1429076 RepID=A0A6I4WGA1_9ACTN|nr:carbohydrate kinase family protein [Actinomadura rayongensis]MXQ67910.1 carbohydrate kinase family protein [Actinomadura rayongensis]
MSAAIAVIGVASLYASVGVRAFPLEYAASTAPEWMGISVSGAATHVARIQRALGDDVRLCCPVGRDLAGTLIRAELDRLGLVGPGTVDVPVSSTGLVLADTDGRRMGMPHLDPVDGFPYPFDVLRGQACAADLLVLTNARFVRPLVGRAAGLGVPIAVDVHRIAGLGDDYDRPWLEHAEIVFGSHERMGDPRTWIAEMFARRRQIRLLGVGMGARGAVLGLRDGRLIEVRTVARRGPVNTSGAGDALFATFLSVLLRTGDPVTALRSGVVHASWKIAHRLPVEATLDAGDLDEMQRASAAPTAVTRWDR